MSLRAEMLRWGLRMLLKRGSEPFDVEVWRSNMRRMERWVPRPPGSTETVEVQAGQIRFHRITTPASRPQRNVLYLHGGAYISGAPIYYRHFTWRIANATKACVWALEYRLAPEHPFPAALEDAVAGFLWLAERKTDTSELFVMGDSAGAGLSLCLLLKLRDEGKPLPHAAVAMSPWTDLALTGPSLIENAASDPMLNADDLPEFVRRYLAGADPRTPYASPLYGDPSALPPVLIQVGSDEILRDDAVRMARALKRENPCSRLAIWPRMPHVFQLFVPVLPEAHGAIAQIGDFISDVRCAPGVRRRAAT
ncbi:alpha/beta hydrolase [Bradyrhizobium sp. ISRA443]|uniref:alpha/beta hydrolase n=1 Tax=unclassified Bradyrhizobium TaxID=2631580 RepID=UPI002479CC59|nr:MULTISPECIES: alpha/beta hydrolase [unclassified Bradyrhizobium]WGS02507.1 alpha/beta hydrolase [Bradyrhizobium sp. ISRA436]WGS09392.1 alpha/beta hydrolase [Bradyrhizobium sp. ISRA437]WGS16281.1 alpha/beta hydrolase [Bradyrhizobium sp. ISRA443]